MLLLKQQMLLTTLLTLPHRQSNLQTLQLLPLKKLLPLQLLLAKWL
jgi:hypothetical protein